jgi:general nucleoside transport system permease protein
VILAAALQSFEGLLSGSISAATPILLAALGGMYTYYAGVFNIAMEGMMLGGAFGAVATAHSTQSWALGVLGGVAGASVLGALFVLFVLFLRVDEFVTGIALNLAAVGATTFALRRTYGVAGAFSGTPDRPIPAVPRVRLGFVDRIPILRALVSGHTILDWVAIAAIGVSLAVVFRTRFGLRLRASGFSGPTVDASGVSVRQIRIWSVAACTVLCGLAGAFLSLGYLQLFGENMSNGRGWIALAAIIVVKGHPAGIAVLCGLFGLASSVGLKAQGLDVPPQFSEMLPSIATLVALGLYAHRRGQPRRSSVKVSTKVSTKAPAGHVG